MLTLRSAAARGLIALPLLAGAVAAQPAFAAHHPATTHKTYTVKMVPGTGKMSHMFYFQPAKLTIKVGDTVQWVDANKVKHDIVGVGVAQKYIDRVAVDTKTYSVTFKKTGTYKYECYVHLPEMVGQITVTK